MGRFVHLGDGLWVRSRPDGKVEARRFENVAALARDNQDRQRQSKRNPRTVHTFGPLTKMAEMSPTQQMQMEHETGGNPDHRAAWIRDHPEVRTEDCGANKLPPRRKYFFRK
jgi:hypothetical protein